MKKLLATLLSLVLLLGCALTAGAAGYANTFNMDSGILFNADTGEVMFSKDPTNTLAPQSSTKLLTALVVLDQSEPLSTSITLDDTLLTGTKDLDSETLLESGDQLTISDLLTEMLLSSSEDGALILANYFGGQESFVAAMNEKAKDLGMADSHFTNPYGGADEEQQTTAEDLMKLTTAVMDCPELMSIVQLSEYTFVENETCSLSLTVKNENFLLRQADSPLGGTYFPQATGMLAWENEDAGYLIASAQSKDARVACILLGDSSRDLCERWYTAKDMLSYGLENAQIPAPTEATQPETEPETAPETTEVSTSPSSDSVNPSAENKDLEHMQYRKIAILILMSVSFILVLTVIIRFALRSVRRRRLYMSGYGEASDLAGAILTGCLLVAAIVTSVITLLCAYQYRADRNALTQTPSSTPTTASTTEPATIPTDAPTEAPVVTEPPETEPAQVFSPHCTELTDPENWGIKWDIIVDDEFVETYQRKEPIFFKEGKDYFTGDGIITFRGDNYRSGPNYGTAELGEGTINRQWSHSVGDLNTWSGCGWTGQPLVMRWDAETRAIMNLYEDKKEKEDLVEVIYATLDGYIYFLDLDDGTRTRDPLWIGHNFKGAGALDPRGYPVLYVGSGDYINDSSPRMFIISLIDGSILYSGGHTERHSLRGWNGFDSSPLVDAETDTLIWPGENGLFFTIKLNSAFDKKAGTFTVDPDQPVMTRYTTARTSTSKYWVGYEDSVVIVDHYMYVSDNGGMFYCIDVNTMELIWAQDTKDDSNSTPVFEWGEDGNGYIYTAPSLHYTTRDGYWGSVSIYKLDAQTGEIIWERPFEVGTVSQVSGGVQGTPLLGKPGSDIENLIIYPVARTPDIDSGVLVALDKNNGSTVWEHPMSYYAWSSPTAIYDEDGTSYIFLGDFVGNAYLMDGTTGETLDSIDLGSNVEASPIVYGNKLVIGTRGASINMLEIQ